MKKKIKVSTITAKKIESKKVTRGKIDTFVMKFLANFGISLEVLRIVEANSDKEEYNRMALSQHIVTLISLCETLFRDIFVCILEKQEDYRDKIITTYGLDIENNLNIATLETRDILPEFFNFQNIYDIEKVFKLIIQGDNFYHDIGELVIPLYNPTEGKVKKFSLNRSFNNWFQLFDEIIQERHKIVHDSNYTTEIKLSDINRYQKVVLFFSQILSLWIVSKFGLPYIAVHIKEDLEIPYILTLEDFSKDWELVD